MTTYHLGLSLFLTGWFLWAVSIFAWSAMQRQVPRTDAPKGNRAFLNLFEAFDRGRVRREHQRLFPTSTRRNVERICRIVSILFFVAGLGLMIAGRHSRG